MSEYKSVDRNYELKQMIDNVKDANFGHKSIKKIVDLELPEKPISLIDHIEKNREYQEKSLEMLHSINENTANLSVLVELISKSNDKQDELLDLILEILTIAKAKEEKEAESMLKKVMKKITSVVDATDTMIKLTHLATIVYDAVVPILKK